MGIDVNFYDQVVYITSPTTQVTVQEIYDALRAAEDSPEGISFGGPVKSVTDGFVDGEGVAEEECRLWRHRQPAQDHAHGIRDRWLRCCNRLAERSRRHMGTAHSDRHTERKGCGDTQGRDIQHCR